MTSALHTRLQRQRRHHAAAFVLAGIWGSPCEVDPNLVETNPALRRGFAFRAPAADPFW